MSQNGADCDGTLSWDEPVNLWRALGVRVLHEKGLYGSLHAPFEVRPWSVPLEVGYTLPSRTAAHLTVEGAVARWAYDDNEMKGIAVDHPNWGSAWRQRDYDFFTSGAFRKLLQDNQIKLVTWRDLRKVQYGY